MSNVGDYKNAEGTSSRVSKLVKELATRSENYANRRYRNEAVYVRLLPKIILEDGFFDEFLKAYFLKTYSLIKLPEIIG